MSKILNSELIILKALWSHDQLSAKELHRLCGDALDWSFSSTRTTLKRMSEKQLITSEKIHGITIFRSKRSKIRTLAHLMKDFLDQVLEVEGPIPTSAFRGSQILTDEELEELSALMETLSEQKHNIDLDNS